MKFNFSSLSLCLETSLSSFGLIISSISSFVEFQFTEEMLMQVSVSRIPDPRSTQAGRPRTGGRRLQSS